MGSQFLYYCGVLFLFALYIPTICGFCYIIPEGAAEVTGNNNNTDSEGIAEYVWVHQGATFDVVGGAQTIFAETGTTINTIGAINTIIARGSVNITCTGGINTLLLADSANSRINCQYDLQGGVADCGNIYFVNSSQSCPSYVGCTPDMDSQNCSICKEYAYHTSCKTSADCGSLYSTCCTDNYCALECPCNTSSDCTQAFPSNICCKNAPGTKPPICSDCNNCLNVIPLPCLCPSFFCEVYNLPCNTLYQASSHVCSCCDSELSTTGRVNTCPSTQVTSNSKTNPTTVLSGSTGSGYTVETTEQPENFSTKTEDLWMSNVTWFLLMASILGMGQ